MLYWNLKFVRELAESAKVVRAVRNSANLTNFSILNV